jgi:hypothetical protein
MAYPPGDPQLTKDYEDWVHGTVYEEGSSACLYDCEKLLIHDIGEKTDDFSDEVVLDLTAAQCAYTGIMWLAALSVEAAYAPGVVYPHATVEGKKYTGEYTTVINTNVATATKYAQIFASSDNPLTIIGQDPVGGDPETGKADELNITLEHSPIVLTPGDTTFRLDAEFCGDGGGKPVLHVLKWYLIYSSGIWGMARFRAKGDGGITW